MYVLLQAILEVALGSLSLVCNNSNDLICPAPSVTVTSGWITIETFTVFTESTSACGGDDTCIDTGVVKSGTCTSNETHTYHFETTGCKNIALQISPGLTKFDVYASWDSIPTEGSATYHISTYDSLYNSDNIVVVSVCATGNATLNIIVVCKSAGL
jgi:hypothetical protein